MIVNKVAPLNTRYQIWDVKCSKDGQRNYLKSLDTKGAINIWKEQHNTMDVMVDSQRVSQVEKLLQERDIPFTITIPDIGQLLAKEQANSGVGKFAKLRSSRRIDWKDYYPLNCIYDFMDGLEAEFPATCSVNVIGKTEEGRPLKVLKISNSDASNFGIWIDGTIHAREWISTSVVTFIADYIARNFNHLPEYITNKDWYFLPVMNPDGYAYSHVHDRMWRKNRSFYGGHCCGVDLNRNFGFNWGRSFDYSSTDPYHTNFRGTEPFSEPESTAVRDVILYSSTTFKVFISFHSYSEVITFPWCHTSDPCGDYVRLLEGGTTMAKNHIFTSTFPNILGKGYGNIGIAFSEHYRGPRQVAKDSIFNAIYEAGGHMYKVGSFKDLMYAASGTSVDWSYGSVHIPYSYLIELRDREHRFLLPKENILDTCHEMLHGILALMNYVHQNPEAKTESCQIDSKGKKNKR